MYVRFTTIFGIIVCFGIIWQSCVPASDSKANDQLLAISDPLLQSIHNYQNNQQVDSLTSLFSNENKYVRQAAAEAFGSMKIKGSGLKLTRLLKDSDLDVKSSAAYALGQIGGPSIESTLVKSFIQKDSTVDLNNQFNKNILASIGKIGSLEHLKNIASVSSYKIDDDLLLTGQASAIYRYALRDIYDDSGTSKMVELLSDPKVNVEARKIAANYFYRAKDIDIEPYKFQIAKQMQNDPSADIRMACAASLAKTKDPEIQTILINQLDSETDYRVKCNVIRALSNFKNQVVTRKMIKVLDDPNIHVSQLASEYLYLNGNARDIKSYRDLTENNYPWQVQSNIYKTILRHVPNRYINTRTIVFDEIKELYNETKSPYAKAAYLKSMSEDVLNYKSIYQFAKDTDIPVVKTALIEGFQSALESPKWDYAYNTPGKNRYAKGEIASYMSTISANGDSGQLAVIGQLLSQKDLNFKSLRIDYGFLNKAINKLELPKELESFNFLVDAINYLQDTTMQKVSSTRIMDIDWSLLEGISDSTSATIRTTRGDVILLLKPSSAPSTVSNFIKLAKENFYDNKVFHRVVPNFVAQGGCPRGDGFGSLDYTIRTEVPSESYNTAGKVGMASAGNHTESCQFFITHSPTMHLDGSYTIFAEVIDGMDIVHELQIGDRINDVIIHTL